MHAQYPRPSNHLTAMMPTFLPLFSGLLTNPNIIITCVTGTTQSNGHRVAKLLEGF